MASEMPSFYTASASSHVSGSARSPAIVDKLVNKYSSSMSPSTSTSPSARFAAYPKSSTIIQRCIDRVRLGYYRYQVTFGVYVMTPGERFVANAFVLVSLSLLIWALLLYFPQLLFRKIGRLVWLLTGHSDDVAARLGVFEQQHGYIGQAAAIPTSSMAL